MISLLLLSSLSLSTPVSAAPLESALSWASRLGVPTAAPAAVPEPASAPKSAPRARSYEPISADAWISGGGSVHCAAGSLSGWLDVRANVDVRTDDGASGSIPTNGTIFVHGSCQGAGGFITGSGTLRGSGYLYKDGQGAGSVDLSGDVFINQYANESYVWVNSQRVTFRGSRSAP